MGAWRSVEVTGEIDQLIQAWLEFDEALRMRQGFNEERLARLKEALRGCAASWESLDALPRAGVNILVDIFPATESNADLYDKDVSDRIMQAAFELQELVGECVALPVD
jgi:hypothetical protein